MNADLFRRLGRRDADGRGRRVKAASSPNAEVLSRKSPLLASVAKNPRGGESSASSRTRGAQGAKFLYYFNDLGRGIG